MTDWFNQGRWEKCFELVDPVLRDQGKVDLGHYAEGLREFQAAYGVIRPWHLRISLYLDASSNKHDPRPFAFVYLVWQDRDHGFHLFRERWVKDHGPWFSRVAGLVPNRPPSPSAAP